MSKHWFDCQSRTGVQLQSDAHGEKGNNTMKSVYLDWVVIQHMKNSTKRGDVDGLAFKSLVLSLGDQYHFPYSEVHVRDLLAPEAVSDEERKRDIEFLKEISKGGRVFIKEGRCLIGKWDLDSLVSEVKVETVAPDFPQLTISSPQASIDMSKLDEDHPFYELLKETDGKFDGSIMIKFLQTVSDNMDDPAWYKKFRETISNLKKKYLETPNTLADKSSEWVKGFIPFLDFYCVRDETLARQKFRAALEAFLSIDGRSLRNLKWDEWVPMAYLILDFHADFRDRIKKENKPSNMYRDLEHFLHACGSEYFVTEDIGLFKKSSMISRSFGLPVKVVKMSSFIEAFDVA